MQRAGAIVKVSVGIALVIFRIILYAINYPLGSPTEIIILNMISLVIGASLIAVGSFSLFSADQAETFDEKALGLGGYNLDEASEGNRVARVFASRNGKLVCGGLALVLITVVTVVTALEIRSIVTFPIKTSLGDLVKIEKTDRMTWDDGKGEARVEAAKSGDVFLVLSFEGQDEIHYGSEAMPSLNGRSGDDVLNLMRFVPAYPIVDSSGKESWCPMAAHMPNGRMSFSKLDRNGHVTTDANGRWIITGTVNMHGAGMALVCTVPKDSKGLKLVVGSNQYVLG
jgi:hypothetical protein